MKILLVAINSKYVHLNLAVHYLKTYVLNINKEIKEEQLVIKEFTINNSYDEILKGIYEANADMIAFSAYIWNIRIINDLAEDIKKIHANSHIWLGGPEVSFDCENILRKNPYIDGIMVGEGEKIFSNLVKCYIEKKLMLEDINGIVYRDKEIIRENPVQSQLDISSIPFPYTDTREYNNKIVYYESSRGCPFSCSYCLSSIDKKVRFRNIDLVKKEIQSFLDSNVKQVKFVDRTFNCNRQHAKEIWKYIKENDNNITNFHFEISADIINDDEIELLSSLRQGQVQFEIGVQSTNELTIKEIKRTMDFSILSEVVRKLKKANNIHLHLDVIAGLPYEDFKSFIKTFNDVYLLKADQLQLGFLKVLKGSYMGDKKEEYEIKTTKRPPYEVLSTKWLSYDDLLKLKAVESMLDIYYNSRQFTYTIMYLEHFFDTPFHLYYELSRYYIKKRLDSVSHSRKKRYSILNDFFREEIKDSNYEVFKELLLLDLYLREKLKSRPEFIESKLMYEDVYKEFYKHPQNTKANSHIEIFEYDLIASSREGRPVKRRMKSIFNYLDRSNIDNNASVIFMEY